MARRVIIGSEIAGSIINQAGIRISLLPKEAESATLDFV
jgi:hypothetical protein